MKGTEKLDKSWDIIGRRGAKEMGRAPKRFDYIKAKGFLCHELLYLLGGRIEFILLRPWQLISIFADIFLKHFLYADGIHLMALFSN